MQTGDNAVSTTGRLPYTYAIPPSYLRAKRARPPDPSFFDVGHGVSEWRKKVLLASLERSQKLECLSREDSAAGDETSRSTAPPPPTFQLRVSVSFPSRAHVSVCRIVRTTHGQHGVVMRNRFQLCRALTALFGRGSKAVIGPWENEDEVAIMVTPVDSGEASATISAVVKAAAQLLGVALHQQDNFDASTGALAAAFLGPAAIHCLLLHLGRPEAETQWLHIGETSKSLAQMWFFDARTLLTAEQRPSVRTPAWQVRLQDVDTTDVFNEDHARHVAQVHLTLELSVAVMRVFKLQKSPAAEISEEAVCVLPRLSNAVLLDYDDKSVGKDGKERAGPRSPDDFRDYWSLQHGYSLHTSFYDSFATVTIGESLGSFTYPRGLIWRFPWILQPKATAAAGEQIIATLTQQLSSGDSSPQSLACCHQDWKADRLTAAAC